MIAAKATTERQKAMQDQRKEPKNQYKKDFLWSYASATRSIEALAMQLKALEIEKNSLRGISYEGGDMPHGHEPKELVDVLIKYEERKSKLVGQLSDEIETQNAVLDVINHQRDATEKKLLTCRYIRNMSWKEISVELGLTSESRPREIHGEALENLLYTPPEKPEGESEEPEKQADGI